MKDNQIKLTGVITKAEPQFSSTGKLFIEAAIAVESRAFNGNIERANFPFRVIGNRAEPFSKLELGTEVGVILAISAKESKGRSFINALLDEYQVLGAPQNNIDADIPF